MDEWTILRTEYKISDFYEWKKNKSLKLSPSFQRRHVWSPLMKSFFIDTIVRGFPVPVIFLRERTDIDTYKNLREVVDGQQRLRTVLSFIDPGCLEDYDYSKDYFQVKKLHNSEIYNKDFKDLDKNIKQRILDYQFSVHVLPNNLDDPLVLQIFSRMNSTGVRLNPQELRNANYFGSFKTTMYMLALEQLDRWRKWGIFLETSIARMDEVEATSDLVNLIINGFSSKAHKLLNDMYEDYDEEFLEKEVIINRFRSTMDSIEDVAGNVIKKTNFNKETIFYYLFALVYEFKYSINSKLIDIKPKNVPLTFSNKILEISDYFKKDKYPAEIYKSATRRPTETVRKKIFDDLIKKI